MDELASHSMLADITNVTIERRHKCITVGGEEECRYGCGVGVIHGGIPQSGVCPPAGDAHDNGQYPWHEGGGVVLELCLRWPTGGDDDHYPPGGCGSQYSTGGGDGGHIEGCPTVKDPPHDIMGVGPI
jgi:hypothetical protein